MAAPSPTVANLVDTEEASTSRHVNQHEETIHSPRPFHSCFRCNSNAINGSIFVPPKDIPNCSSHTPAQYETGTIKYRNYICPGFVNEFQDVVFNLQSVDCPLANKDAEAAYSPSVHHLRW